jgi:hypothetical protein
MDALVFLDIVCLHKAKKLPFGFQDSAAKRLRELRRREILRILQRIKVARKATQMYLLKLGLSASARKID